MRILLFLLFVPFFVFGQKTYKGVVIDKENFLKVPYATIGLCKENIGTNADENGFFTLQSLKPEANDTLIISSVGFLTERIPISRDSDSSLQIRLTKNILNISPLVISPNFKWSTETLNGYSDCGKGFITSSGYLKQLAQHFTTLHENALLSRVKICRATGSLFRPEKTIFRIRVYDMDELLGCPGKDLCDTIIEVKSQNGSIDMDLEKYKIRIPNQEFFIAVEWLKIPYNEKKMKPLPGSRDPYLITYTPTIGWQDADDPKNEMWELNYRDAWVQTAKLYGRKQALISATVKY